MSTVLEYKCPCCDGSLEFDSNTQNMKCPYCDNEFDVETLKEYDDDLHKEANDNLDWDTDNQQDDWDDGETDNMASYICEACAGEIIVDETTSATSCPYCGNQVIIKKQFSGMLKPNFVLPFKLSKDDVKKALQKHIEGKRLLPDFFKKENHIDNIQGIYVPFWLFDCEAQADLSYKATKVRHWSDSRFNYTKTDHFLLRREGTIAFEKVPVDGSTKMDDTYMESIEPFDYNDLVDFQTAYLSGYLAEKYDVDSKESIPRANTRIKSSTLESFNATTRGYTTCIPSKQNIDLLQGDISYALLPVWILNTKYKGKIYTFAMNAQTGKFVGELPVDRKKFWKYSIGIFTALTVAGSIIATILF